MTLCKRRKEEILAIALAIVIVCSIVPQTISLFTHGYVSGIDSGSTIPLDYEYSAAKWIKQNTPANTIIISDPITMEVLSGLADRSPLMLLSMGNPSRPEDQIRLRIVFQLLTSKNESTILLALNELKAMGLTTEEFYHSFLPVESMSFIILISQRTSIWLDSNMSYPVVYFNSQNVNNAYLQAFMNPEVFNMSYKVNNDIYIFTPVVDYLWTASSYSNDVIETQDPSRVSISFGNQTSSNFAVTNGTTLVDGKVGTAALFNGQNDYITMAQNASLPINDSLTLEAWIKPSLSMPTVHNWNVIVSKGNPWTYMLFYDNINGQLDVGVRINGTAYYANTPYKPDDQWHYLVGTYTSGKLQVYLDGILKKTVPTPNMTLNSNSGPIVLGALDSYINYTSQTRWSGAINNVNIYNRTLNDSDVANRFQDNVPKLAVLGSIEIPFKLPSNSSLEIQINAANSQTSDSEMNLQTTILDETGNIVASNTIQIYLKNQFETLSIGTLGPLNSNTTYTLRIINTSNAILFVDKVSGKIV